MLANLQKFQPSKYSGYTIIQLEYFDGWNFGPPEQKQTGFPGPENDQTSGVVYDFWGHNSCPDSRTQLVYQSSD